jgi:NitT/TauT family transport system permease protein
MARVLLRQPDPFSKVLSGMPSRRAIPRGTVLSAPFLLSKRRGDDPTMAVAMLCRSLAASTWQTFVYVHVPYAIPHIVAGLKVGVAVAIIGEFVTVQEGLGYISMFASSTAETTLVFAAIILLCAIGMVLYGAVALAEWLVRRWYGAPISVGGFA